MKPKPIGRIAHDAFYAGNKKQSGGYTYHLYKRDWDRAARAVRKHEINVSDLVQVLDNCDAAMTAASKHLWDTNRHLAIKLNQRALACRLAIIDLQSQT